MSYKQSTTGPSLEAVTKQRKAGGIKIDANPERKGTMVKGSERKLPLASRHGRVLNQEDMKLIRSHLALRTLVEYKEPVPTYQGKDAPSSLRTPPREFAYVESPPSQALGVVLMEMFKEKEYSFALTTALNMSSSGAGLVNSVISVGSVISSLAEFSALSGVFNEFFVREMHVQWQPNGRYNGPMGFVPATTVSSLPIGLASLQHGAASYTSLTTMTENYRFAYANTSDPFSYSWVNVESPSSTTTSFALNSQNWLLTSNAANYGGLLQIISQPVPPALPVTAVLGTFAVSFKVLFRIRE